jgi:hypothetical protein
MKKVKAFLILLAMGLVFSIGMMAQPPQPPAGQGTKGDQPPAGPSGSPIDGGLSIFLVLAAGYGLKKIYNVRREPVK